MPNQALADAMAVVNTLPLAQQLPIMACILGSRGQDVYNEPDVAAWLATNAAALNGWTP